MKRRNFIKTSVLASLASSAAVPAFALDKTRAREIRSDKMVTSMYKQKHPLALTMWDFSWLQRCHKGGGFENLEKTTDALALRGYDAVRIDVFPNLIYRSERDGTDTFKFKGRPNGNHALWGNDVDVVVNPREKLIEMMTLARERGIKVDISTWFREPLNVKDKIEGLDQFVEMWDSTIKFLEKNNLMDDNVIFIDYLNEYPLFHGFRWLKEEAARISKKEMQDRGQLEHIDNAGSKKHPMTAPAKAFYKKFSKDFILQMRKLYPQYHHTISTPGRIEQLDFLACVDYSVMDLIDSHYWFSHNNKIGRYDMGKSQFLTPAERIERKKALDKTWANEKEYLISWLNDRLAFVENLSKENNVLNGSTEGWGCVGWDEYPEIGWDFIKEAAFLGAELGLKRGMKFVSSANFTHPHFKTFWDDIKWHQKITTMIKKY